jgi:hypothetical protein
VCGTIVDASSFITNEQTFQPCIVISTYFKVWSRKVCWFEQNIEILNPTDDCCNASSQKWPSTFSTLDVGKKDIPSPSTHTQNPVPPLRARSSPGEIARAQSRRRLCVVRRNEAGMRRLAGQLGRPGKNIVNVQARA